ncbi:sulfite exporter TauE/SafE family protein [Saprospiraceae bacterium]|nr:sulfite exporter TauE/SafE family protein [Saprospiraceae bacterium]
MELTDIICLGLSAFLLGLSKSGFKGLGVLIVTLLAIAIPAKESTGVLLPLLIIADTMAVYSYRKDVQWNILKSVAPFMMIGVLIGVVVGDSLSNDVFKKLMAAIILISALLMIYASNNTVKNKSSQTKLAVVLGTSAGFTTMIGNLAGPFINIYFLAIGSTKNQFIATAAWLFFVMNLFKLPFHIFIWKTINSQSLLLDLKLLIPVIIGFVIGFKLIKYFSNEVFRKYIIGMTILGAILIFLK